MCGKYYVVVDSKMGVWLFRNLVDRVGGVVVKV